MKKTGYHIFRLAFNTDSENPPLSGIIVGAVLIILTVLIPVTLFCLTAL